MTYFELFEIPVQLQVDKSTLPKKYFELSRKFHPDFYVNSSPEEQADALEKSALLNKAFRTLQQPDETIRYVLELKGMLEEEEKYELPPSFLMEMMDINEALMEAEDPMAKENVETLINQLETAIAAPVQPILEAYKDEQTTGEELKKVKEYYFKKKYIGRIRQQLNNSGKPI